MGAQQSQVRSSRLTTFHPEHYTGTWFTVSGGRKKICHHWDNKTKKMKIVFKDLDNGNKDMFVASVNIDKVGSLTLDNGTLYIVHWTDYHHYSFITLDGNLYVLSRLESIRECETELITLALKGCDLHDTPIYIVDKKVEEVKRENLLEKSDFWSEIGKNSGNKNTYESKFSN